MKKLIMFLLLISSIFILAHEDFVIKRNYGKVKVEIITGYYYEEIYKTMIIGQYVNLLANRCNFSDSISLRFKHLYTNIENMNVNYKICERNNNEIYLFSEANQFEIRKILELIYLKINKGKIKNISLIEEILSNKIERPNFLSQLEIDDNINYYYQDDKYYIYRKDNSDIILKLNNLYQIKSIGNELFVFDKFNSLYYINSSFQKKNINFTNIGFYNPIEVKFITNQVIAILLRKQSNAEIKVLIYLPFKNKLFENID